jgi:predicted nucleic acid-binding protein
MAEAVSFLDTNILLRHLLYDVPDQSRRATAYLRRIERGELTVRTADSVIMETVFTLQRQYRFPGKQSLTRVFDIYVEQNVSFVDAYHGVLMAQLGIETIVSFDRRIERVPGIRRVEP